MVCAFGCRRTTGDQVGEALWSCSVARRADRGALSHPPGGSPPARSQAMSVTPEQLPASQQRAPLVVLLFAPVASLAESALDSVTGQFQGLALHGGGQSLGEVFDRGPNAAHSFGKLPVVPRARTGTCELPPPGDGRDPRSFALEGQATVRAAPSQRSDGGCALLRTL